jgi:septum formation protein
LAGLGLDFAVRAVDLDETPRPAEAPPDYVRRLAIEKAEKVAHPGELVLAADTTVVLGGEILGKPDDTASARGMLARIAGREHQVLTAVALLDAARGRRALALESSRVWMAAMSDEAIAWYAATGEPLDKAGSYAVQGLGAVLVERICGNYTNVVGLPIPATVRLFAELGYDWRAFLVPTLRVGTPG